MNAWTDPAAPKIDAARLTPAKLTDSFPARAGDFVTAGGNLPGALGGTVAGGIAQTTAGLPLVRYSLQDRA